MKDFLFLKYDDEREAPGPGSHVEDTLYFDVLPPPFFTHSASAVSRNYVPRKVCFISLFIIPVRIGAVLCSNALNAWLDLRSTFFPFIPEPKHRLCLQYYLRIAYV